MVLYTCSFKSLGSTLHPCSHAASALQKAGLDFEYKVVGGFKNIPFTTGGGKRDEVVGLSGQAKVPILVLDDETVISGSKEIAAWAKAHPAA